MLNTTRGILMRPFFHSIKFTFEAFLKWSIVSRIELRSCSGSFMISCTRCSIFLFLQLIHPKNRLWPDPQIALCPAAADFSGLCLLLKIINFRLILKMDPVPTYHFAPRGGTAWGEILVSTAAMGGRNITPFWVPINEPRHRKHKCRRWCI